ncbi:MAG: hypothetical protein C0404_03160 [Verrucomicrobia bacterium]|nr:hypothetical protein [Verrucomicrobiota bacterium]
MRRNAMTDMTEQTIKLLLVEDDPDLSLALKATLEENAVEVTLVESGEDALACFDVRKFDALVSDIRLQTMNGVELLSKVRETSLEFPVILLTAYDSLQTAIQAVKLGAQDYILKPMDSIDDILKPLRRSVRLHRTLLRSRLLEAQLRESEARFRGLVESSSDHIFMLDRSGRFLFSNNRVALAEPGKPAKPVTGSMLCELHTPENAAMHQAQLDQVFASGKSQVFEYSVDRNGVRSYYQATLYPVRTEGAVSVVGGIARDISDIRRATVELADSRDELRALSTRLEKTEELERSRIAADLHDLVGQKTTTISVRLAMVRGFLPPRTPLRIHKHLRATMKVAEEIGNCTRTLMYNLRPAVLDDCGLFAALRWLADDFPRLHSMAVEVKGKDLPDELPKETSIALFRIAQEALMNSFKHARAAMTTIALTELNGIIELTIEDNGVGFAFNPAERKVRPESESWGLVIMRERAQAVGGSFAIRSAPGVGTTVSVSLKAGHRV